MQRGENGSAVKYLEQGLTLIKLEKYDQAIVSLSNAIKLDERLALANLHRGTVLMKKGKLQLAIVNFTTAIDLEPNLQPAFFNRGMCYAKQADLEQSRNKNHRNFVLTRTKNYNDNNPTQYYILAITDFTKAIELDSENVFSLYNRGMIHFRLKNFNKAISDFIKILTLNLKHTKVYLSINNILSLDFESLEKISTNKILEAIKILPEESAKYFSKKCLVNTTSLGKRFANEDNAKTEIETHLIITEDRLNKIKNIRQSNMNDNIKSHMKYNGFFKAPHYNAHVGQDNNTNYEPIFKL